MIKELTESQKLDILLSFKKEYNLGDTDDPSVMTMNLGNGYTLFASVKRSWFVVFNDGVEVTEYDIESSKVPFTNAKDARTLWKKYEDGCKRVLAERSGEMKQDDIKIMTPADETKTKFDPEIEEKNRLEREANERRLAAMEAGEIQKPENKPARRAQRKQELVQMDECVEKSILPAIQTVYNFSEKQLQAIKDTVAKGASDSEFEMLMYLANRYQLDPILKEIFYSPQMKTIMTSRDGYLKIAQRSPDFEGMSSMAVCENDDFELDVPNCSVKHRFGKGDRGKVIGSWAIVYRTGRRPQLAWASTPEYKNNNPAWKYVSAMSCKCSEIFALKRAYSISGLVTQEEMGTEENEITETVPIIDAEYMEVEA